MNEKITVDMAAVALQPDEEKITILSEGAQKCNEMMIPENFVKDVQMANEEELTKAPERVHTRERESRNSRNVGMDR